MTTIRADEDHVSMGRMHRANGLNPWRLPSSDADVGLLLPLRSVLDGITGDLFVEQERNSLSVLWTSTRGSR
jgi:hypothetical protein